MRRGTRREAPNYTLPALIMGGINLFWIMMVIWVAYGLVAVLAFSFALERGIHWLSRRA